MLRNGRRICCVLYDSLGAPSWRMYGSAKPEHAVSSRNEHEATERKPSDRPVTKVDKSAASEVQSGHGKPLTQPPFVKNLFLGKFDTKMLVFPEVLTKEEIEDLNQMVEPIERYYAEKVDSTAIDRDEKIPDDVYQSLKDFGLFGQQIPQEYGGLEFNATKFARMAEVTVADPAISVMLGAHQSIGLKGLLLFGTEEQKAKYLPKLATGEYVAAFCLTETSSGSDAASIQTSATLSDDGRHYLLNGEKIFISNGGIADVFTVFARTKILLPTGETEDKVSAFFVERAFGGVTSGKPESKLGMRGSNTCSVYFDNTPVPIENVIGEVGAGFKVAVTILNSGRFSMGPSSASSIRKLLAVTSEHAIQRKQFGRPLKDFGLIQVKLANMALDAYAMDSMGYVTAGILDSVVHADAAVEAAIVKVFSSDAVQLAAHESLQIMGGLGYMQAYPYERYLRDSRILSIFEGTNEILRLFISLTGMQHAGLELRDMVRKMRDPLNNLSFTFKKAFERVQTNRANPSLRLALYDHVHPDLSQCGEALEVRVVKYRYMVEKYLSTFADKIIEEQLALKRFADVVIDLYAITSVLARASRSKSIGLQHCDHEILLARTFVANACKRIDQNLIELDAGKCENGDENVRQIAEQMFKVGGYVPVHPLTRNW